MARLDNWLTSQEYVVIGSMSSTWLNVHATAPLVSAQIRIGREKLHWQIASCAVDFHTVEPGTLRQNGAVPMFVDDLQNFGMRQGSRHPIGALGPGPWRIVTFSNLGLNGGWSNRLLSIQKQGVGHTPGMHDLHKNDAPFGMHSICNPPPANELSLVVQSGIRLRPSPPIR
jgi:hypothetical protein